MHDNNQPPYVQLTETILGCCFDVMNELGSGFLESVYKNALFIAIKERTQIRSRKEVRGNI